MILEVFPRTIPINKYFESFYVIKYFENNINGVLALEILLNQTTENCHVTLIFVSYPNPNRCPSQKPNPYPNPNLADVIKMNRFQPKGKL